MVKVFNDEQDDTMMDPNHGPYLVSKIEPKIDVRKRQLRYKYLAQ
jgi:hypothetical protein